MSDCFCDNHWCVPTFVNVFFFLCYGSFVLVCLWHCFFRWNDLWWYNCVVFVWGKWTRSEGLPASEGRCGVVACLPLRAGRAHNCVIQWERSHVSSVIFSLLLFQLHITANRSRSPVPVTLLSLGGCFEDVMICVAGVYFFFFLMSFSRKVLEVYKSTEKYFVRKCFSILLLEWRRKRIFLYSLLFFFKTVSTEHKYEKLYNRSHLKWFCPLLMKVGQHFISYDITEVRYCEP